MREEIQAYKRERILQEAVALFYARGFTATTLDDIAAALGVTKGLSLDNRIGRKESGGGQRRNERIRKFA